MLVLGLNRGEKLILTDTVSGAKTIIEMHKEYGKPWRLCFTAPKTVTVVREKCLVEK